MKHENSAHNDDQQTINEHVVYLYQCSKLSLTVFTDSLTTKQKDQARAYLKQHLKAIKHAK